MGEPGIKSILDSLQSPLEAQRERAVEQLVRVNDVRAIPALQKVASRDESVRIRYLAKKALFVLKQRLGRELPAEGPDAVAGLQPTGVDVEKVREIMAAPDPARKLSLLKVVARNALRAAIPALLEAAASEADVVVRSNIVIVLGMLGTEANVKDVAAYVHDPDPRVRANAIEALEYLNHPNAYPIIVNGLADPDNRIRANAIKALRNYGKVNVVNLLRKMLRSDQVWMRDSAAFALSLVAKDEALPLLIEALRDENATIRRRAHEGLGKLAHRGNQLAEQALEELEAQLDGAGVPLQVDLGHLAALAEQEPRGENLLKSPDAQLRMRELRSIVDERDASRLLDVLEMAQGDPDAFIKANAVIALGKLGDEHLIDTLREFLASPVDRIRANAIEALAMIGGDLVPPLLIPHLDDRNNRCKANAIIALKDHKYVNVLKPLADMVHSDELLQRKSAFYAITDLASDEVLPLLEPLTSDPDPEVRKNARHFLQMMADGGTPAAKALVVKLSGGGHKAGTSLTGEFFVQGAARPAASASGEASSSDFEPVEHGSGDFEDFDFPLPGPGEPTLDLPTADESSTDAPPRERGVPSPPPPAPSPAATAAAAPPRASQASGDASSLDAAADDRPFRYSVETFSGLSQGRKRAIIEELRNEVTYQAYLFLRDALNDKDFEIKCLAKVALKNFENEDFASAEASPKDGDRNWIYAKPEIETVEYQGFKKTIQLSRDLNDKAQQYEYTKLWKGPFDAAFAMLNALRDDTIEMIQFLLKGEELRHAVLCFQQDRLKPFMEGTRTLDGNRFANVVTLTGVVNRQEPYAPSAKLLRSIKRPIYLIGLFTDARLILFLRGPLETSFAKYVAIPYQLIDSLQPQPVGKDLQTLVLHLHTDYQELPELYAYVAKPLQEFVQQRCAENLKKEQLSGRFNPEEELRKLETLLKAEAITKKEYQARRARIERMLALSGVYSKAQVEQLLKKGPGLKDTR